MNSKIKKIMTLATISTLCFLYLLYIFVIQRQLTEINILRNETNSRTLIHETQLKNYFNMHENEHLLLSMHAEGNKRIIGSDELPRAIVNVSNLMIQNNIIENRFRLGSVTSMHYDISAAPLNISGLGQYSDIIAYLADLNSSNELLLIDRVNISLANSEENIFYLDLNILIIIGDSHE